MDTLVFLGIGLGDRAGSILLDFAIKGLVLMVLTAFWVLLLRHDSAAMRHAVWFCGILAVLALPLFSVLLPRWQALPQWTSTPPAPRIAARNPAPSPVPDLPETGIPLPSQPPPVFINPTAISREPIAQAQPSLETIEPTQGLPPQPERLRWTRLLVWLWAVGCLVLTMRLALARTALWFMERRAARIGGHPTDEASPADPILGAWNNACQKIDPNRPVALMIHPRKTIPLVWGWFHSRLLLPADAGNWPPDRLQSVLLHELAHIKRHDTLTQLAAQLACALHWFNPLVWFAACRLGVERERACDDLVLASGVQPSAYAGHLLEVAGSLPSPPAIPLGGLAMARTSSLERRLIAVLHKTMNRRGVSAGLASLALMIALGTALPLAMLQAAPPKPPNTREREEPNESSPINPPPKGPGAASQNQGTRGVKLKPSTEQLLKWGEPSNGLRMALAWPPSLNEPFLGNAKDFQLVIQNISQSPLRLTANDQFPNPRRLMLRDQGSPLAAFSDPKVMKGDWHLQPGEAAIFALFQENGKLNDGRTLGEIQEETVRAFPQYSLTAEMTIAKAPQGAWSGTLKTGQTRGSLDVIWPKDKDARELYETWTTAARLDGKIPAGVIAKLGESVRTFIKNNPSWSTTLQLQGMLPRFEPREDLSPQNAVSLLDELATLQSTPIGMALENERLLQIRTGTLLPKELSLAPWGDALPNGLRLAWLLEPNSGPYPLGSSLKARILIHNSGKKPVVFRTRTWHQMGHTAKDAKGMEIKSESVEWTTRGLLLPYRLDPGDFIEVNGPGIGVGANKKEDDWQYIQVGTWLDVKPGDEVTVLTNAVPLSDWTEKIEMGGEPRWWLDHIKSRLERHLPFPPEKNARERLLYRVAMELFGTPLSREINDAFVADQSPTALDSLAERLFHRPGLHAWSGALTSGPTQFRVLPADPNAAKKPRIANGPGRYNLGDFGRFFVLTRTEKGRMINEGRLVLNAKNPKESDLKEIKDIPLPEGYKTWAIAWTKDSTTLWIRQKDSTRSYDFSNPASIKETVYSGPMAEGKIPRDIHEALGTITNGPERPKSPPAATGR